MVKLSGILEYSMGGFLCLRGFADYKTLSRVSKENPDVQRSLIEEHKGEMAEFLNRGLYRFFPEVVLSVSLLSNNNYADVERFFETVRTFGSWKENLGNINISIFNHEAGDKNRVAHFAFDESIVQLNRVDGNHRLSAADEVTSSFKVPFCLVLCRNTDEESQYSRAIFHNINSKQIPLKLEENLKVILTSENAFSNEVLKTDPSFGWAYYLARVAAKNINFSEYPFINLLIQQEKYTFLKETFDSLLNSGYLPKADIAFDMFSGQLPEIDHALREAQLHSLPQNIAVIGALSFYKLTDQNKYHRFICWIKENCIADAPNIHMHDLISIYDKVFENSPKSVFMSMKFGEETVNTYQTVKDVKEILKRENNIDLKIIKVDEHEDGYSDEIYADISARNLEKRIEMPKKIVRYTLAFNKPVEIDEGDRKIICSMADHLGINITEDFFILGNLSQSSIPTGIMGGYSFSGTDAEKEKYDTIQELLETISKALEWAPVEKAFDDKKCLKLALQNCGTDIDEDIEISLRIPKNSLLPISEFPKFDNDKMGYLLNDCDMSELFGICSTSTYSHYDSSIVTSRRFSPRVSTSSVFSGYVPNYNDDFESELADVFSYSCFGEGEEYIVKIKFDYIKHNTIIAFPSVIFIKAPFTVMPYTITSKNSPKVVSGEIKITEDMQHQ